MLRAREFGLLDMAIRGSACEGVNSAVALAKVGVPSIPVFCQKAIMANSPPYSPSQHLLLTSLYCDRLNVAKLHPHTTCASWKSTTHVATIPTRVTSYISTAKKPPKGIHNEREGIRTPATFVIRKLMLG
jgi:hypothetical protein